MDLSCYTLTQRTIVQLLSDYKPHPSTELQTCLDDGLAPITAIHFHISQIRKSLRLNGLDVLCVRNHGNPSVYQLVRLTASPYDGHK
jgi:hypothetical protein